MESLYYSLQRTSKSLVWLALFYTLTSQSQAQTTRYVSTTGTTSAGGATTWATATTDLQGAIDASASGDQVWVAGGTYYGTFSLKNGVAVYGGFVGSEMNVTQRPNVNPITGMPSSTTLTVNSDGSVVSNGGVDQTAILDGVVITGGSGGFKGGGISNQGSSPTLMNCVISGNTGGAGGGIYNFDRSSPRLTNCVISGNTSSNTGGGIYNSGNFNFSSNPILTNCVISGNTAQAGGGIENSTGSSPSLTNCLIQANQANQGGGIRAGRDSNLNLVNCTLTANRAGEGAALFYTLSQVVLTNTILYDNQEDTGTAISNNNSNSTTANYCLIGQGETDFTGTNNLTATTSPFMSGTNFTLKAGSQAIDAGDPASTTATSGATDLAGKPRIAHNRIDIGAYEFQGPFCQPVAITQQPVSGSAVCVGSTVTASVSVSGTVSSYQWYKDNLNNPVAGQNLATFTLSNVQLSDAGSYSVVVTGACNIVTSTAFSLTVNPPPTLATVSQASPVCPGQAATIRLTGLPENAVLQVRYTIGGVEQPPVSVTTSNMSMGWAPSDPIPFQTRPLTAADNGVALTITRLTILSSGCSQTFNTSLSLSVNLSPVASLSASGTLTCAQTSLTLTASGGSSYRFIGPGLNQNGASNTATVSQVGVYSVTVTNGNGCTNTASTTVSGSTSPPTASLSNDGPLTCAKISVRLTAGGGSTGGPFTYKFSTGATLTSPNTATVSQAGVYSVTVTSANGCSATASTTVGSNTATPTVSISPAATTVCAGKLTTLTASGADTYRWSTGAITASISVSATTSTTYSVTATTSGGCSATASARLTVNPRPDAPYLTAVPRYLYTTNFPIPLIIYALPTSFNLDLNFYKTSTNGRIDPPIIQPTQPGTFDYYATQTDTKGCVSVPAPISLTVLSGGTLVSKPADRSVCPGSSTVLSVTATGGNLKYSWYEANPDTPLQVSEVGSDTKDGKTANLTVNNVRQTKLYYCLVIGDKGVGVAGPIKVSVRTNCGSGGRVAAGEPTESLQVRVLGNPVTGDAVRVMVEGAEGQSLRLSLVDQQGRPVSERLVEQAGAREQQTLPVGHQPASVLLLRVSTPTQTQTLKVLKVD